MSDANLTPATQAKRIHDALAEFYTFGAAEDLLEYALCDLRHLADAAGLCFGSLDQRAYRSYQKERDAP